MKHWLGFPSVQIALCLAVFAWVAWRLGPFGAVWASPLLAAAIAYPVYNLVGNIRHGMRERTWLPVHGQHYVFKGTTIHVLEDDDRCRWISLADMNKVAGITAGERALELAYPERCKRMGKTGQPHLRDDALIEHLGKESNPVALRFRTWAERTVAFPGRKIRESLGIRPDPPYME
ncbi:MAG: hypothetical protein JWQ07_4217 [Ramlibacter sp.]|nr:hypothetical protein [Ramlibacter sp.]